MQRERSELILYFSKGNSKEMRKSHFYFYLSLILVSALLVFGLVELLLGLTATLPVVLLIYRSYRDQRFQDRSLVIAYILGSLLCWVFGFLGCFYFLRPEYEIAKHPLITMVLINLVTWGALLATKLDLPFKKNQDKAVLVPEALSKWFLQITGLIFLLFLTLNYTSGFFSARFEIGRSVSSTSPLYFLQGLSILQFLVFFFAGTRLTAPLFSARNISLIAIPLIGGMILSLSGGREFFLRVLIYFLIGALYSTIDRKLIKLLLASTLPVALSIIVVIGYARGFEGFGYLPLSTRIDMISQVAQGRIQYTGTSYDNQFYSLLTRITEPSGQTVIDQVVDTSQYIGFENLDRITKLFIPKFIYGDDKKYDDNEERLLKYGFLITEFTSPPITLMADLFERGSYLAVFLGSIGISYYLMMLTRLICNLNNLLLKQVFLTVMAVGSIRLYSMSVLGAINFLTYGLIRDFILVTVVIWLIKKTAPKPLKEDFISPGG